MGRPTKEEVAARKAKEEKEKNTNTVPEMVICVECTKEVLKAEAELVKNRYTCKACLPAAVDGEKPITTEERGEMNIKNADDRLDGMKAISKYAKRSESTLLNWRMTREFPIYKDEHIWISSKTLVDRWWNSQLGKDSR